MNAPQYDAIVIGSGAGGAATAYRLVQGGLKVILLEKGDHLPVDGSTLDIQRVVHEGKFLSREIWKDGRGRSVCPEEHFNVGGKTKWYGAALLRFGAHEFQADSVHQCTSWPVSLADMEPYYQEAERLLGVRLFDTEPNLADILCRLKGKWDVEPIPLSLAPCITADRVEATHFDGFASVAGLKGEADGSILSLLRGHPGFTLSVNAEVFSLLGHAASPATIVGVELTDGRRILAPRVFLAAGALHSPRILGRYLEFAGLGKLLPIGAHIGRNVKLHLLTALIALSGRSMTDLLRKTVVITHEQFGHSSVQPLGFDSELIATLVPKAVPEYLRRQVGRRSYGFFLQTEDGSDPRNRVIGAINGADHPVLDYDEDRTPSAAREHKAFTRAFQWALAKAGFLTFTRRIGLNGTAHACGSLVCGEHASSSVVDRHGQVHGMAGLYVVDGSVLPRSSRVNPSLTIYAWGLRVADRVAKQFAGGFRHA
ncbi:MAG: GMC family oxidoreductase [Proteobacteria bacterium]|nr:GMC family oxidoreductase [Pseudomonadota bacterium]